jgi:diadenosine tetraphosphate (Ap4A) HIT family hydrolase
VSIENCAICEMANNVPDEGWIYENDSWIAGTLPGLEIPGWIVLALRRHAVDAAPLTAKESLDLGVAIAPVSTALANVTKAERIYLQAYGENESHWHLLLSARGKDVPIEHRHVQFFVNRQRYLDVPAARQIADQVRTALGNENDTPVPTAGDSSALAGATDPMR